MKGIILAGGTGSRLYPGTKVLSKQLLNVYDKPMIYYSLSILLVAKIKDILIITSPDHYNLYKSLFKDGSQLGVRISYEIQSKPRGLVDAFIIGEKFIGNESVCLVLGDNIVYGNGLYELLSSSIRKVEKTNSPLVFGYEVENPEDYGVAELDDQGRLISLVEKPKNPKSNLAIIGIYMYPNNVIEFSKKIRPSKRGELEITSLNQIYLTNNDLDIQIFGRGFSWFDTGTYNSILEASNLIRLIEKRSGLKIGCLEEISFNQGFISKNEIKTIINELNECDYKNYLKRLIK